jgi:hypothetical protein
MKQAFTLALPILLGLPASATVPPGQASTLYRHLVEVNVQWATMDPALADDPMNVRFNTEAERIAMHLHLVADRLRSHFPPGISTNALAKRSDLLSDLDAYADRGLFPRNEVLPYRNPVFIDPAGTACAVGQLMIESGHRTLAEDISRSMNLAYVKAMHREDVLQWATEHGFTEDELAWIQPGYPPTQQWEAVAGGTDSTVTVVQLLPDNTLLLAGDFTEAGGVAAQHVAVFNGTTYTALGAGVAGTVICAAVLGGDIYLGGYSLGGTNDLAKWDGSQWTYSTVFGGKFPFISALHVHNGELYAAGVVQGFAGPDCFVAQLQGLNWNYLPGEFNDGVACLASFNGELVAGGAFTEVQVGTVVTPALHVAHFTPGGWAQVGNGLDGMVLSMDAGSGMLYAGGQLYLNTVPKFGLARMDENDAQWTLLMPNLPDYVTPVSMDQSIKTVLSVGNAVYIGGDFTMYVDLIEGKKLAQFLGGPDEFTPLASFNADVNCLAFDPFAGDSTGLIAGGAFTLEQFESMPYLAHLQTSVGIQEPPQTATFYLFPVPTDHRLTVRTNGPWPIRLRVTDNTGRTVLEHAVHGPEETLDLSALAPGSYVAATVGCPGTRPVPFIKH